MIISIAPSTFRDNVQGKFMEEHMSGFPKVIPEGQEEWGEGGMGTVT